MVRQFALRRQILDVPNERSSHTSATPRGGGVAVVAVCAVGWAVALALGAGRGLAGLAVAALTVAAVSWIDDVRTLTTRSRFLIHAAAAGLLLYAMGTWGAITVPLLGTVPVGLVGIPLAFVWVVGLTNAYNFMDGIDGVAALQAVMAGAFWAAVGYSLGVPSVTITGLLIGAGSAGFLVHNWSPARIFMGDVGSAFLGLVFAALPLEAGDGRVPLGGLLCVWPFVFDASYTFIRRLRAGEDVFAAHRSHLYQRMTTGGRSHRFVASLYGLIAVGCAVCGFLWVVHGYEVAALVGLVLPIGLLYLTNRYETAAGA